ncbi:hypothetical protein ABFT80_22190 [Mesorhizobium sp. SB112]|uniref:hypothetical protein n=1 Tax=Mesorhizobium sp. SB112 TaxID=3151853 RepID=UPI0032630605
MKMKLLSVAAMAFAISTGAAFAQAESNDPGSSAQGTNSSMGGIMDNPTVMSPFYTDESMKTLRSKEEVMGMYGKMAAEDQAKIKEECANVTSPRDSFCETIKDAK